MVAIAARQNSIHRSGTHEQCHTNTKQEKARSLPSSELSVFPSLFVANVVYVCVCTFDSEPTKNWDRYCDGINFKLNKSHAFAFNSLLMWTWKFLSNSCVCVHTQLYVFSAMFFFPLLIFLTLSLDVSPFFVMEMMAMFFHWNILSVNGVRIAISSFSETC